jgi:hypothetical protein
MSNYEDIAINPKTGEMEKATWCDDYYGPYHYGVRFADGEVYPEHEINRVSSLKLFTALTEAHGRGQRDMQERIVREIGPAKSRELRRLIEFIAALPISEKEGGG